MAPLTAVAAALAMLFAWLGAPEAAVAALLTTLPAWVTAVGIRPLARSGTCVGGALNCGRIHQRSTLPKHI